MAGHRLIPMNPYATIDLEKQITTENRKALQSEEKILGEQAKLDAEVNRVLEKADADYRGQLMTDLGFDYKLATAAQINRERAQFSMLPQDRIMHVDAIKATCLKYSLRFLPTRLYKGALDAGIGAKLEEFRGWMNGKLPVSGEPELCRDSVMQYQEGKPQFYIAAPAESFALQPVPRDPLLFCRLSASKFFLLHKWGTDLEAAEVKKRKGSVTDSNWNSSVMELTAEAYYRLMQNTFQNTFSGTTADNNFTVTMPSQSIAGSWFDTSTSILGQSTSASINSTLLRPWSTT